MPDPRGVVAVFNASQDTVDMICAELTGHGYRCVPGHVTDVKQGETDFIAFIEQENPQVIVWDISPPYDKNWAFFQLIRSSTALRGRGMVLTTTHKTHLDQLAGENTGALEIIGKPYDLNLISQAVGRAMPTRV